MVLRGARFPGDVAIHDGRIVALGTIAPEPDDEVVRCDGDVVTAGLVNTHHHLYQWMTRGRATGVAKDDIAHIISSRPRTQAPRAEAASDGGPAGQLHNSTSPVQACRRLARLISAT